jgi:hypothetical protein
MKAKIINDLLYAGQLCSNCCFNIGQETAGLIKDPVQFARIKQSMREAQKAWDRAWAAYYDALHKTKNTRTRRHV